MRRCPREEREGLGDFQKALRSRVSCDASSSLLLMHG